MNDSRLTAEQFEHVRPDLPEGGRWVELVAGRVVQFDPPDPLHGNVVLHLSKALATYLAEHPAEAPGYLCFDLGLLVERHPDTIHFPAISYFVGGNRFSECDKLHTDVIPRLIVEIASTNLRRRGLVDRIAAYQRMGVGVVWIVDTIERQFHVVQKRRGTTTFGELAMVSGEPVFPGLQLQIAELVAAPAWWK